MPQGVFNPSLAEEIENNFLEELLSQLWTNDEEMASQFILAKTRGGFKKYRPPGYICQRQDKLLFIKARETSNILSDYCDYTIATIGGICSRNHPQLKEFHYSSIARSYIFQRYIMLEYLLSEMLPPLDIAERNLLFSLLSEHNNVRMIFDNVTHIAPTTKEYDALSQIIYPRTRIMQRALNNGKSYKDTLTHLSCLAYHGDELLRLSLYRCTYEEMCNRIRSSYLEFGN